MSKTPPPRSLSSLTLDEIKKALDLASKDTKLEGNVVLLTDDRYDKALAFLKEHFVPDEPMYKSLGIQWSEELADIRFRSAFRLNLSFVLEDPESNEIIAIRSTKIAKRGSSLDLNTINDVLLRELCRAENTADERAKFFKHYGEDEAIQFLGLGVHKKHRGKGLATKLMPCLLHQQKVLQADTGRNFWLFVNFLHFKGPFYLQIKLYQIIHTRLRNKCSSLNFDLFQKEI